YPATADLPTWKIGQCVRIALDLLEDPPDPLPAAIRSRHRLMGYGAALHQIHRPESFESLGAAKKRLKWQEALVMQAALVRRKAEAAVEPATPRPKGGAILEAFDASLPFPLTDGQRRVGEE